MTTVGLLPASSSFFLFALMKDLKGMLPIVTQIDTING
jgi:hypothetical protein